MPPAKTIRNLWIVHAAADFAAVAAAYYTTLILRFHSEWGERLFTVIYRVLDVPRSVYLGPQLEAFYHTHAPRLILLLTVTLCALYALQDLYTGRRFIFRRATAWNIALANLIALGIFFAYFYLSRNVFHPRSFFATILFLNVFYCIAFRAAANRMLAAARARGIDRHPAVVLGSGEETEEIVHYLNAVRPHGIDVVRRVDLAPRAAFDKTLRELVQAVRDSGATVIVSTQKSLSVAQIMKLLESADELDAAVKVLSENLSVLPVAARIAVDFVGKTPLVHFERPSERQVYKKVRDAMGVFVAAAGLVLLAPVFLVTALLIKATSRGPVFFVQERIGVNRKPFHMVKFRTMYDRAEENLAQLEEFNESGKVLFKIRRDPRVTPVGRFLRRFSIDELPQLVNVIRGEMTLVGPRPLPRKNFEDYYEEWHYGRHEGLPGLTCIWQVSGRSHIDFHNMCILDVYYLRNQSWMLDLRILLKTVWVVLFAKGAY